MSCIMFRIRACICVSIIDFGSISMIFGWIMELFRQSDIVGYSLDRRKGEGISMSELTVKWNWTY